MANLFILDANALIIWHRRIYPFDIAPLFWRQLAKNSRNKVVLLDRVRDEIFRNQDPLSAWLRANEGSFLNRRVTDHAVVSSYTKIINEINRSDLYKDYAKEEFADVADSWICAYAMAGSHIVVTDEKYEPASKKKSRYQMYAANLTLTVLIYLSF